MDFGFLLHSGPSRFYSSRFPLLILAGKWEPIARGCLASTPSSLLQSTLAGLIGSQENREIQWSGGFSPGQSTNFRKSPEKTSPNGPSFSSCPGRSFHFHQLYFGDPENAFSFYLLISLRSFPSPPVDTFIFAGVFGGEKVEESAERWAYALGGVGLVVRMTLLGTDYFKKKGSCKLTCSNNTKIVPRFGFRT